MLIKILLSNPGLTLIILFIGALTTAMFQLNWLYLMQDQTFEKNILERFIIGVPIGGITFTLIWKLYLLILKKLLSQYDYTKIVKKDTFSMFSFLRGLLPHPSSRFNQFSKPASTSASCMSFDLL